MMFLSDIEKEILNLLKNRDYEYPYTRKALESTLRYLGLLITKDDRPMRLAIESLRKKGYLVCHRKGNQNGYFIAKTMEEYEEFRWREYKKRIISASKTLGIMDKAAEAKFGQQIQLELFYF